LRIDQHPGGRGTLHRLGGARRPLML
jgi:hypothetical protein